MACSGMMGGASDPLSYMPSAAITEPWSKMSLPLDGGKVTMSDAKLITVMYSGSHVDAKLAAYEKAVLAASFTKQMDVGSDASTKSIIFDKGGKHLTLTVTTAADITTVSMSRMD